jgi:hypothetical protein
VTQQQDRQLKNILELRMDNGFGFFIMIFAALIGGVLGHDVGKTDERRAITECEKTLPRNVQCTIVAVPVDKN